MKNNANHEIIWKIKKLLKSTLKPKDVKQEGNSTPAPGREKLNKSHDLIPLNCKKQEESMKKGKVLFSSFPHSSFMPSRKQCCFEYPKLKFIWAILLFYLSRKIPLENKNISFIIRIFGNFLENGKRLFLCSGLISLY